MNNSTLIRTLRKQVVDDRGGTVCCRPVQNAQTFVRLGVEVARIPAPQSQLLGQMLEVLEGTGQERSYATCAALFDVLEDGAAGQSISSPAEKLLMAQCGSAIQAWDSARLKQVLSLLLSRGDLWNGGSPDPLPVLNRLAAVAGSFMDLQRLTGLDLSRVRSCLRVCSDSLEGQELDPTQRIVSSTIAGLLAADGDTEQTSWTQCRLAAVLLQQVVDTSHCVDHIAALLQEECRHHIRDPQAVRRVLEKSKNLFIQLGSQERYRNLYTFVIESVAAATARTVMDEPIRELLVSTHPERAHVTGLINLMWDEAHAGIRPETKEAGDDPDWRAVLFRLCWDERADGRQEQVRAWLFKRLQWTLEHQPDQVDALVDAIHLPDGTSFPDGDELRQLGRRASLFPDLRPDHVQTLARQARHQAQARGVGQWATLYQTLESEFGETDQPQWLLIGLELIDLSLAHSREEMRTDPEQQDYLIEMCKNVLLPRTGDTRSMARIVETERAILQSMGWMDRYPEIYRSAVEGVAVSRIGSPLDDAERAFLIEAHPHLGDIDDVLADAWALEEDRADPMWQRMIFSLCRTDDGGERQRLLRTWLLEKIRNTLATEPGRVKDLIGSAGASVVRPIPSRDEGMELLQALAGLPDLTVDVVNAAGELVDDGKSGKSARQWCDALEEVETSMYSSHRRHWLLVGLDLIRASMEWDHQRITDTAMSVRSFVELMTLGNLGHDQELGRLLKCKGDILNGSLLLNSLRFFPELSTEDVITMQACGLGVDLTQKEIRQMQFLQDHS